MSPSMVDLVHAAAHQSARRCARQRRVRAAEPALSILASTASRRTGSARVYTIPVVRELRLPPALPLDDGSW